MVVAQYRYFDFARVHRTFHQNLHRKFRSQIQCGTQFRTRMHLRHPHRRTQRRRLHKKWIPEFLLNLALSGFRIALPIRAIQRHPRHHRNLCVLQKFLRNVLIHAHCRAQHSGAHKWQPRQIQQALNRSVFAVRSVHNRKNHIQPMPHPAPVQRDQRRVGRVRSHHDTMAAFQHIRQ